MLVEKSDFNTSQNFTTSEATEISEWHWHNTTRCSSHSHDLPHSNNLFVGRNEEMMKVIQLLNVAHIISINGAPGFGKSQLAIHVGYEMVSRGTNVRYIDAVDKLSYLKTFGVETQENARVHKSTTHKQKTRTKQKPVSVKSLAVRSSNLPTVFGNHFQTSFASDKALDHLLKWSRKIDCHTVLILDNCDDIIHNEGPRETLIQLIRAMVKNANDHLHIIITSRQQILLLDDFESIIIKELSQVASVELLLNLSPGICKPHAEQVASLVEGCPLALKVVGKLLHKQNDTLTKMLKDGLLNEPMRVLDRTSTHKERFSAIMDVAYEELNNKLQECGYYLSMFNGSFEHNAGLAILPSSLDAELCLESYYEHCLLDKYNLEQFTLYKMHRLIRKYLRRKGSQSKNSYYFRDFEKNFCRYFTNYVLQYAKQKKESNITERDEYLYSSQLHNIHHFLNLLLTREEHLTKELVALVFAVGEELISANSIKHHFHILISKVNETCFYVKPESSGKLFSFIIKELYKECRCNNIRDYFLQMLESPCMDLFSCETVAEIQLSPSIFSRLHPQERNFLFRLRTYHCDATLMAMIRYMHYLPLIKKGFLLLMYIFTIYAPQEMLMVHIFLLVLSLIEFHFSEKMVWMILQFPDFFMNFLRFLWILAVHCMVFCLSYDRAEFGFNFMIPTLLGIVIFDIFIFSRFIPYCF